MEVTIYYKKSSYTLEAERVITTPENSTKPDKLEIYGADGDEYHNIDAMGLDYDVITKGEECLVITNSKIKIKITD